MQKKQKRRKPRHFSAKDAARCVAYARRDGADDAELAKYIIYSFGVGNVPCLISQAVLLVSGAILLGTVFRLIRGLMYLAKGLKLLMQAASTSYVGYMFADFVALIESEYGFTFAGISQGQWLVWIGTIQSGLAAFILFCDNFADQIVYYHFLDKVCSTKIADSPYKLKPKPLL